jgi:ornithine cyclodeaminase
MRFFDGAAVDGRLAYPALVDILEAAFRKGAIAPLRHHHTIALDGRPEATLLLMPAWEASAPGGPSAGRYLGVKSVTVFPDNAARGKPAVLGTYSRLLVDLNRPFGSSFMNHSLSSNGTVLSCFPQITSTGRECCPTRFN